MISIHFLVHFFLNFWERTPTIRGSNHSIQSNGSGPGHSCQKSKRPEFQPRGEAQMEDDRTSASSQILSRTFASLIESPEAEITAIPVVRPESFPTASNRDIPVSLQELVYGLKAAGVGTSAKSLDRHNELLSSSEEVHGHRKDRRIAEVLDTHVLQGTSPTDKSLVENQSMLSEDQKQKLAQGKYNSPVEAPQASTSTNPPQQVPKKGQEKPKEQSEGKSKGYGKGKTQVEQALTHRITEFP
ncbi:hypothetical protein O181_071525 [Austropuccinia psidii MF-1]|uniref:Uncharacterized protein n=1 Tax=Austropuccinia psidii MF-1 TaxID=1389203 RepID=A0A9Q3EYN2_9BASI|nr:hypothetical protein [Austropuccinia psidii MF-1]